MTQLSNCDDGASLVRKLGSWALLSILMQTESAFATASSWALSVRGAGVSRQSVGSYDLQAQRADEVGAERLQGCGPGRRMSSNTSAMVVVPKPSRLATPLG